MVTQFRRRAYRDLRKPASMEDFHMSSRYIAILCILSALGTALVLLTWLCGQPFIDALFGG